MYIIKLILIVFLSLVLLTVLVEVIEFYIIMMLSDQTFSQLSENQETYFAFRNKTTVLVVKPIYTFLSAFLVSYICFKALKSNMKSYFIILSTIQSGGIFYGAFFSAYQDTLPIWYWFLVLVMTLSGFKLAQILSKKGM